MPTEWNHNIHYHPLILSHVPRPCAHALDVGCGHGLLLRQLAPLCDAVTGIDLEPSVLSQPPQANLTLLAGDVLTYPFADRTFDLITAVATLHHLPLEPALLRFRDLLAPGGVLAIIGLYRPKTPADHLAAAAGLPASWLLKRLHAHHEVTAPQRPPGQTLHDLHTAAATCLPGAILRRRLLFRYSLFWHKPTLR